MLNYLAFFRLNSKENAFSGELVRDYREKTFRYWARSDSDAMKIAEEKLEEVKERERIRFGEVIHIFEVRELKELHSRR